MANETYLCPTKNHEEFYDIPTLKSLLEKRFPKLIFKFTDRRAGHDRGIDIGGNDGRSLLFLECYRKCNLSDYNLDIVDFYDKIGLEDEGDRFIEYKESGDLDMNKCIKIRYRYGDDEIDAIEKITKWLRFYFQCLEFNEGIYPEVIFPETTDIPKKKSYIKRFGEWLKK